MADLDLTPLNRIVLRLQKIQNLDRRDVEDLGKGIQRVIIEDNRKGVLSGQDKDGNAAPSLKYRNGWGSPTQARPIKSAAFGTSNAVFKGASSRTRLNVLANNNLPTRIYKKLDGPRLAPRREASRVIANLAALPIQVSGDTITIGCGWFDVISAKGRPFLRAHFDGTKWLPKYDLRGIRPWGMETCRKLIRLWASSLITGKPS